ncbi:MAG: hypothetical protein AABW50_03305 [Nanoarchaeota archaeon]
MTLENKTQNIETELKVGDFVMKECPNCHKRTRMRYDGRSSEGMDPDHPENVALFERLRRTKPEKHDQWIRTYKEGLKIGNYTCQVEECKSTFGFEDNLYKE